MHPHDCVSYTACMHPFSAAHTSAPAGDEDDDAAWGEDLFGSGDGEDREGRLDPLSLLASMGEAVPGQPGDSHALQPFQVFRSQRRAAGGPRMRMGSTMQMSSA